MFIISGIIIFLLLKNNDEKNLTWKVKIESKDETCIQVIQKVYEDEDYEYNVSTPCYASSVYIVYSNGEKYTMIEALNKKKVTPDELIEKGVSIFKNKKY